MSITIIKALHIIGLVSWFAGLFYIVRLYIYHVEADQRPEPERKILQDQFAIMQRRLMNGITTPAMIFTTVFGIWLGFEMGIWSNLKSFPYMHIKLTLLIGLFAYHFHCMKIRKNLLNGEVQKYSSKFLRLYNEVATILLVVIVFTVVIKDLPTIGKALTGFAVFFIILALFFKKQLQGKSTKTTS